MADLSVFGVGDDPNIPEPHLADLSTFMQAVTAVVSLVLTLFYCFQFSRHRASVEVIYVSTCTLLIYSSFLLSGSSIVWVKLDTGLYVPLGRYFTWLLTCPVILMQLGKLHKSVSLQAAEAQNGSIIVLDQLMLVCAAFGALTQGIVKWVFFASGVCLCTTLYIKIILLTARNYRNFPEEARRPIIFVTAFYFVSWIIFPVGWVGGPAGLNTWGQKTDQIVHAFGDLISKCAFGLFAWYVRWCYLDGERDSDGRLITMSQTKYIKGKRNSLNYFNNKLPNVKLHPWELDIALSKKIRVILLERDSILLKLMQLMCEKVDVEVVSATSISQVKALMVLHSALHFDAVIIAPQNHGPRELESLRGLSEYCAETPFKIPLLGIYFDDTRRIQEPGYYLHGILTKPLDEGQIKAELMEWRVTTVLWRKLNDSMERIEASQLTFSKKGIKTLKPLITLEDKYDPIDVAAIKNAVVPQPSE